MSVKDWAIRPERGVSSKEQPWPKFEGGGVVGGDLGLDLELGVALRAGFGFGMGWESRL